MIPDLSNPQSWNRFAYTLNSPINYADPTGHSIACDLYEDDCHHDLAPASPAPAPAPGNNDNGGGGGSGGGGESGDHWWDVERGTPDEIFDDMSDESDIAFNYPLDGCYARAQIMMMRILQRYGILPDKVWAFGSLQVSTNGPYGNVGWGYHVAPVIPSTRSNGTITWTVIDPSIAKGPVTVDQWLGIMQTNSNQSSVVITSFWQSPVSGSPGHGYFPNGADPYDVNQYSAIVMQHYKQCGELGTECSFVNP